MSRVRPVIYYHPPVARLLPRRALLLEKLVVSYRPSFEVAAEDGTPAALESRRGLYYMAPEGVEIYPVSIRFLRALATGAKTARSARDELGSVRKSFKLGSTWRVFYPGFAVVPAVEWDTAPVSVDDIGLDIPVSNPRRAREVAEVLSEVSMRYHSRVRLHRARYQGRYIPRKLLVKPPVTLRLPWGAESLLGVLARVAPAQERELPRAEYSEGEGRVSFWIQLTPESTVVGAGETFNPVPVDPWLLSKISGGQAIIDIHRVLEELEKLDPTAVIERLLMPTPQPESVVLTSANTLLEFTRARPAEKWAVEQGILPLIAVPGRTSLTGHSYNIDQAREELDQLARRLAALINELIEM